MDNKIYFSSSRLEAFYDAIIAIIVTVLVLSLPQPSEASLSALGALKGNYFAYLISFLICTNLWQYHHLIYNHVEKIDMVIIWQNIALLFVVSLIPYLTIFVAENQFSLLAQVLYGLDFILINMIHFFMARTLIRINPEDKNLLNALNIRNGMIIPLILFVVGLVIAFLGYPVAISFCCLITIVRSIVYSLK
ncbi:TMEM175 family protein [Methanobrevibacter sp.]|uniref:TMEM175 family protein n=1 Tax=Methanobrevibacter sp. TaxID=66852 RepID=UPI00388F75F8